MINIRNTSSLIAVIACAVNAVPVRTTNPELESRTSTSATYTTISRHDELLLETGDINTKEFSEKFYLTEGNTTLRDRKKQIDKFEFTLQDDGNLVLYRYDDEGDSKAIWASDTDGAGNNLKLWLQEDGSLSLRDADSNDLVWSTYTGGYGKAPYKFEMPDPGFPRVEDSLGQIIWAAD